MPLTASRFAEWVGGQLHGRADGVLGAPSIDTRTLEPTNCFFALEGPNFDGHQFVSQAISAGADTVVVKRTKLAGILSEKESCKVSVISVDDTEIALQRMGVWHREQFGGPVVGITGSSGKTTTKEMIKTAMAVHGTVAATQGNLNNHLGVPLSLSKLTNEVAFGVFEMGMNAPNEIRTLSNWVKPDVGIITSIGEAHLEGVGSLEGVANAKGELFETLHDKAFAVCPSDAAHFDHLRFVAGKRLRSVGSAPDDYCQITDSKASWKGTTVAFCIRSNDYSLNLPCVGEHQVSNALCALTTIDLLGLDVAASVQALSKFQLPNMRGQRFELPGNIQVVLDCYNANPQSMRAAISAHAIGGDHRSVLVLGDMLELGGFAHESHRSLGNYIATHCKNSTVLAVGDLMREAVHSACEAGMPSEQLHCFESAELAGDFLRDRLNESMNILIKGSRGLRLEGVWAQINQQEVDQ